MAFSCAKMLNRIRQDEEKVECELNIEDQSNHTCNESVEFKISAVASEVINSIISKISESDVPMVLEIEENEPNATYTSNETHVFAEIDCNVAYNYPPEINENVAENLECEMSIDNNHSSDDLLDFSSTPYQLTGAWSEFMHGHRNNYTRGCKWAPDGSCILTCSDDNNLRIFNLPEELWDSSKWHDISEMAAVLKISEGELIYDFCWYPLMNSADPCTCCLVSCSKNSTVHLWDAFTGRLRCSYRTYDQMDEITAARSLSFDADGERIFCGFEKAIRVFNIDLPGRNCEQRRTFDKKNGQPGIISCFAFTSANKSVSAAGSYQRTVGIYSEPLGTLECVLEGQKGGVTQLKFSPDGNLLYSGGRKDPEILCWDMRNLGDVLYCMRRTCSTNQRMSFDISSGGRYIVSGNTNGVISIWDTWKEAKSVSLDDFSVLEPLQFYLGHNDCVNGISLHPTYPILCSSSGQRKFPELLSDDEDDMFASKNVKSDNSLRLWWIGKCS